MKSKGIFFLILASTLFSLISVSRVFAISSGPVNPYSFSAMQGSKIGTVKLTWYDDGASHTYNLFYGTNPGNYAFGVVNVAHDVNQANEFTVENLTPGITYYFKLCGQENYAEAVVAMQATSETISTAKFIYYSESKNYEMPYLFAVNYGNSSGTVNITWFDNDTANKYDLIYGTKLGEYLYGWQDLPYRENLSNTFTVNYLSPGSIYYFALVAKRDNTVVSWSHAISILAR
jgi:hypothetical protein